MSKSKAKAKAAPAIGVCPKCSKVLDVTAQGFVCHGAVSGPYLKGSVVVRCSDRTCHYRYSTNFRTSTASIIRDMIELLGTCLVDMPSWGPWENFAINNQPLAPRGPYGSTKGKS